MEIVVDLKVGRIEDHQVQVERVEHRVEERVERVERVDQWVDERVDGHLLHLHVYRIK